MILLSDDWHVNPILREEIVILVVRRVDPLLALKINVLAVALLAPFSLVSGQRTNDQLSTRELFKQLSPSVFVIETLDAKGTPLALGSGVSVAKNEVVTNRHVVEDGKDWRVRQGDRTWSARIAYVDAEHDLCGLKVSGLEATPVVVRTSSTLSIGERVYALGSPEGLELSFSEGLISGLRLFEGTKFIQTTAAISHGSSGGGLFDARGRFVGITTFAIKDGQSLNFALPAEVVASLREHPATEVRQTASEKDAAQAVLLFGGANDAMISGDYEKALGLLKQLSQIRPEDPFVWLNIGEMNIELNRLDAALQACQRATQVGPELADSWSCLADVYERSQQYSQAEQAFKKALQLDSPDPDTKMTNWLGLGAVYAEEGNKVGVLHVYRQLKRLDQNYADRFFRQAQPLLDSQDR